MQKSVDQWIQYAKYQHRYILFFEDKVIDITNFITQHPGGKKTLIDYIYKDVTNVLFKIYPH
jgi:cytochrome b involved in lipid metabolism